MFNHRREFKLKNKNNSPEQNFYKSVTFISIVIWQLQAPAG